VTQNDIVMVETVVLRPSINEHVRIARAQPAFAALKEELLIEAPHDTRDVAVI
jgi:hypothetical protein